MDTFAQMLEEDIASFLKGVGGVVKDRATHAVKQFGNDILADLGSHSAAGRYDLAATAREVMDEWKYFAAQQQAKPSVAGVVEFFRSSIGIPMDEDAAYRAIYGTDAQKASKPPRPANDEQKKVAGAFRKLVKPETDDEQISVLARKIAVMAQADAEMAKYVSTWMSFIGAKSPATLKRPSMKVLLDYAHGGMLSKEQMKQLFLGIAKILLKQQMEQRDAAPAAGNSGGEEEAAADAPKNTKIELKPKATMQEGNWGGLKRPDERKPIVQPREVMINLQKLRYDPDLPAGEWKSTFKFEQVNAMTAQLMQNAARYKFQDFNETMMQGNVSVWPTKNREKAFQYMRDGGHPNEVTAELNHFAPNIDQAMNIFWAVSRYVGTEANKQRQAEQSGDQS